MDDPCGVDVLRSMHTHTHTEGERESNKSLLTDKITHVIQFQSNIHIWKSVFSVRIKLFLVKNLLSSCCKGF